MYGILNILWKSIQPQTQETTTPRLPAWKSNSSYTSRSPTVEETSVMLKNANSTKGWCFLYES